MAQKLIHFSGYNFMPNLNPTEMIELGVHGGKLKGITKYDVNMNYFKVYPVDIPKEVLDFSVSRIVLTTNFFYWYDDFYRGQREQEIDTYTIDVHTKLVKWANEEMNKVLSDHEQLTLAKKYGQLLMELAMNPGFQPVF